MWAPHASHATVSTSTLIQPRRAHANELATCKQKQRHISQCKLSIHLKYNTSYWKLLDRYKHCHGNRLEIFKSSGHSNIITLSCQNDYFKASHLRRFSNPVVTNITTLSCQNEYLKATHLRFSRPICRLERGESFQ